MAVVVRTGRAALPETVGAFGSRSGRAAPGTWIAPRTCGAAPVEPRYSPAERSCVLHQEREHSTAVAAAIHTRLAPILTVAGKREQPSHKERRGRGDQPHPFPLARLARCHIAAAIRTLDRSHVSPAVPKVVRRTGDDLHLGEPALAPGRSTQRRSRLRREAPASGFAPHACP